MTRPRQTRPDGTSTCTPVPSEGSWSSGAGRSQEGKGSERARDGRMKACAWAASSCRRPGQCHASSNRREN
jgi:hypothetical protein